MSGKLFFSRKLKYSARDKNCEKDFKLNVFSYILGQC